MRYTYSMFKRLLTFFAAYPKIFVDAKSSNRAKYLPLLSLVYLLMPIDLMPDFIPLLGQLDDIGVIVLLISIALRAFERSPAQRKVQKYGNIIDVEPVQKTQD